MKYFQNVVDTVRDLMTATAAEQSYKARARAHARARARDEDRARATSWAEGAGKRLGSHITLQSTSAMLRC